MTSSPPSPEGRNTPWLLVAPAALAVLLFLVIPVTGTLIGPLFGFTRFLASTFAQAVVIRTLRIAALTTAISVVVGFATAIAVARTGPRLKRALLIAAVFPLLTGIVVRSFAWMVILGRNGMLNTLLLQTGMTETPLPLLYSEGAVIVAMAYLFIPIMILTLVGVLDGIDTSVVEAAASLGAGPLAAFRRVVLPLAMPGLVVGAVLVFTGSFTAFATPRLLGGDHQVVLATLLYQDALVAFDWPRASTIAAIMVAITLAVVLAMTRVARRLNPAAA